MFPIYIRIVVMHPLACMALEGKVVLIPWLTILVEIAESQLP